VTWPSWLVDVFRDDAVPRGYACLLLLLKADSRGAAATVPSMISTLSAQHYPFAGTTAWFERWIGC
jgi:hypothetical protein